MPRFSTKCLFLLGFTLLCLAFYSYMNNVYDLDFDQIKLSQLKIQGLNEAGLKISNNLLNPGSLLGSQSKDNKLNVTTSEQANGCFVVLMRNSDVQDFRKTMQQLEDRFNKNFNYPYVFLNEVPFTEEVKTYLKAQTKAKVEFGLIPKEHWEIPRFLNESAVLKSLKEQEKQQVPYAGKLSYHHMCRYESGLFSQHELLAKYDYYWRVEPEVEFTCDIIEDPFLYMHKNNKKYGFTITMSEFMESIPTLWKTVNKWIETNNIQLPKENAKEWLLDHKGDYNGYHFWSNFEIGSLNMLRSPEYRSYFNYLDKNGGFYFERWGDAPVHSIFVALMLKREEIHFFKNIGYKHDLYENCPFDLNKNLELKCYCKPEETVNYRSGTTLPLLKLIGDPAFEELRSH